MPKKGKGIKLSNDQLKDQLVAMGRQQGQEEIQQRQEEIQQREALALKHKQAIEAVDLEEKEEEEKGANDEAAQPSAADRDQTDTNGAGAGAGAAQSAADRDQTDANGAGAGAKPSDAGDAPTSAMSNSNADKIAARVHQIEVEMKQVGEQNKSENWRSYNGAIQEFKERVGIIFEENKTKIEQSKQAFKAGKNLFYASVPATKAVSGIDGSGSGSMKRDEKLFAEFLGLFYMYIEEVDQGDFSKADFLVNVKITDEWKLIKERVITIHQALYDHKGGGVLAELGWKTKEAAAKQGFNDSFKDIVKSFSDLLRDQWSAASVISRTMPVKRTGEQDDRTHEEFQAWFYAYVLGGSSSEYLDAYQKTDTFLVIKCLIADMFVLSHLSSKQMQFEVSHNQEQQQGRDAAYEEDLQRGAAAAVQQLETDSTAATQSLQTLQQSLRSQGVAPDSQQELITEITQGVMQARNDKDGAAMATIIAQIGELEGKVGHLEGRHVESDESDESEKRVFVRHVQEVITIQKEKNAEGQQKQATSIVESGDGAKIAAFLAQVPEPDLSGGGSNVQPERINTQGASDDASSVANDVQSLQDLIVSNASQGGDSQSNGEVEAAVNNLLPSITRLTCSANEMDKSVGVLARDRLTDLTKNGINACTKTQVQQGQTQVQRVMANMTRSDYLVGGGMQVGGLVREGDLDRDRLYKTGISSERPEADSTSGGVSAPNSAAAPVSPAQQQSSNVTQPQQQVFSAGGKRRGRMRSGRGEFFNSPVQAEQPQRSEGSKPQIAPVPPAPPPAPSPTAK